MKVRTGRPDPVIAASGVSTLDARVLQANALPQPAQLGASVIAQVAKLTVPGVALGLAPVWSASGLLDAFIFGVQARSPVVFAAAGGALVLLAVIATLPPALRAMRVDVRRGVSG